MSPSSWTSLPPHTPTQPFRLSQSTRLEFPASYTANFHWLFNFTYGSVSMLFSQFVPPSPSCIVSTSLSLHYFYLNAFVFTQSLEYYQDVSSCVSLLYSPDRTQRVLCLITLLCFFWNTHGSHIGSSGYILHGLLSFPSWFTSLHIFPLCFEIFLIIWSSRPLIWVSTMTTLYFDFFPESLSWDFFRLQ